MFRIFVLYTLITLGIKIMDTHPGTATNSLIQGMKTFDISHHQQEVQISQEDTIKIILPTQMGTGYRWHWEEQTAFLIIDQKVERKENRTGAAEQQVFFIRPLKKGKHQLSLAYQRSWEKQVLKYYELHLEVSE